MWKKIKKRLIRFQNSIIEKYIIRYNLQKYIINPFHILYKKANKITWNNTFWFGIPVKKCPLDLWIYQEIIFEQFPDIIIESGTYLGGTAFYLAYLCDLIDNGEVISIDILENEGRPNHKRIKYLIGSSTSEYIKKEIINYVKEKEKILVILDSDHTKQHVLNELRFYSKLVSIGSYIIVEDSDLAGNPVYRGPGEGPMEAINEFLKENDEFIIDKTKEKFFMTFNPNGFLKRIK